MKKKGLVLAHFPSPYRVGVFKELSKYYDLNIFFEICRDQNRSKEWFVLNSELNFKLIEDKNNKKIFQNELRNIEKYDFVLAYDYHTVNSMIMQLRANMKRVPYFVNCDGAFIRPNIIKDKVKRFFFKRASLFFASGKNAKKYFMYFGADENKIFIHNFTSLYANEILKEPISDEEKLEYKKELGLSNKKMVLSIGQFIERKGFDILLKGWTDLDKECELVIIGGGELERDYIEIINNNRLKNVKIVGFKKKEEISKYYKAADLFVLPTREDVWGLVVNEAMAYGLPVITTDKCIAGIELINNSINGFIVKCENNKDLKDRIFEILRDDCLKSKISLNNLKKMQSYTIEGIAESHFKVIEKFFNNNIERDYYNA